MQSFKLQRVNEDLRALGLSASGRCFASGAQVRAFPLSAQETEKFDGAIIRVAEPVWGPRVELGRLARPHNEVVASEDQTQPTIQDVDPFKTLVTRSLGLGPRFPREN